MSVVTPTITSAGQPVTAKLELLSIDVEREVNRIPRAELRLVDGDAAKKRFALSNEEIFAPGREIEIKLRYEGDGFDQTVFKGKVVRHGVEADSYGGALVVELKDQAVRLTGGRKSAVFRDKTDADVFKDILGEPALGTVAATQPKHPEIVQFHATDWDFILSRAEANGLVVVVVDGEVSLARIERPETAKHTFEWGHDEIFDFEMEADAGDQFAALESVAWDVKEQKSTQPYKAKDLRPDQGKKALDPAKIGQALGRDTDTLTNAVPLTADELAAWADGRMARQRMALLRGRIAVPGRADVALLDGMEVKGIGERFNGKTLVTGLRHRVDEDGWQTDVRFGLPAAPFSRTEDIVDPPAAGLLPAVNGLQIGVVAPFEDDPDKELRIKVSLPAVDAREAVWARLASLDAGKDRGAVFRPEPGDEVVVGFLNDDPRHPVILGALHSSKNNPPAPFAEPSDTNLEKGIVTKKGTALRFIDNDKASLLIETKNGNAIRFDDEEERVTIVDQHGNKVTMSNDGIVLKSAKDLLIDAAGNVEIKGARVDVK